jgi:hypothetical protein
MGTGAGLERRQLGVRFAGVELVDDGREDAAVLAVAVVVVGEFVVGIRRDGIV